MKKQDIEALIALPVILLLAALIALTGGSQGPWFGSLSIYAWAIILAMVIQWIAFIPAYLRQTEIFYDLTGSLTYLSVIALTLYLSPAPGYRGYVIGGLISIWALRLGSFLFLRIRAAGEDSRFRELKPHFWRFLMAWSLQGLWVSFSLAAALVAISSPNQNLDIWSGLGLGLWLFGFGIEAIADRQKNQFRKIRNDAQPFIQTGLWAWSRHPNYFGEIVLWVGIACMAVPCLSGWQWATLISPVFITVLLTRISGIPMLEEAADNKWGERADYQAYKKRTSVLIPCPPKTKPNV